MVSVDGWLGGGGGEGWRWSSLPFALDFSNLQDILSFKDRLTSKFKTLTGPEIMV